MTTITHTTTPSGNGKLKARLWIGHNPLLFACGCLFAGLLAGRSASRKNR